MGIRLKKRLMWGLLSAAFILFPLPGCGEGPQHAAVGAALSSGLSDPAKASVSAAPANVWQSGEATQSGTAETAPLQAQQVTVYITETGGKYHLSSCSYLAKSCIAIDLETARQRCGPCSKCRPPA